MKNAEIARALFDAFQAGDGDAARAVCAPDLIASQNGGPQMDLATVLHFALAVKQAAPDFRYEEIACSPTETGFVEEHRVRATFSGGDTLDLQVCLVGDVEGGKITALREYFDPTGAAVLAKALSA